MTVTCEVTVILNVGIIKPMKAARTLTALILVLTIALTSWGLVRAQTSDVRFFVETGHSVRGEFLNYYNNVNDPLLLFGYPITEQITSRDGKTVQYFYRARFELSTDAFGNPRVQLTPLGLVLYRPGVPQNLNNPAACQLFTSTGYSVCFQFLDFYRANGGPEQFGKPISPFEFHGDLLVQYFEYARFEWRTDGFNGRVVPTDLGRIYFYEIGEDLALDDPVSPPDATINPILSIHARAFVAKSITRTSGDQTVFVIVQSQTNQTIVNAKGKAIMRFTDGTTQEINFTTNERGVAQFSFNFNNQKAGKLVTIEISVSFNTLTTATKTSFRIWY
jgi:hypothetical protein